MDTTLQSFWQGFRWLIRKLLFLITLVLVSAGVLMLGSGLTRVPTASGEPRFYWDPAAWWHVLTGHLSHLVKGDLVPPLTPGVYGVSPLKSLAANLLVTVPVTLQLVGTAFVLSCVLGIVLGLLLSIFAPVWLRAPLWGITTTVHSVPDLVLACVLDLAVVLITMARGGVGPTQGSVSWQKYTAPSIALAMLVVPYIARLTAAAIDEVSVQEYIRAAVARGIHPGGVLFGHIGKNVLIRVSTALPVVASLLVSGSAIIEYMGEVHGVGRAMLIAVSRPGDGYEASVYLVPLLVVFTFVLALQDGGQHLLDPRVSGELMGVTRHGDSGRLTWRDRLAALTPGRLWGAVREFGIGAAFGIRDRVVNLPATAGRWGRALKDPVLLAGVLLVLGLAAVAVLAPRMAPFAPLYRSPIFSDRSGTLHVPPFLPDRVHPLGTDDIGRDMLSRLMYGTRYALLFAMLVVPARLALAAMAGLLAAFRGGLWEKLISWLGTFFTAVPQALIPLALIPVVNIVFRYDNAAALVWGTIVVALPGIPRLASAIRQQALQVMAQPFVEGAYALGASTSRTLFKHILPQMAPQLATMLALEVPAVLTLTAILGYFRANPGGAIFDTGSFQPVAPVIPEWGSMMETPLMLLLANRWWMWAPFAALFVAVLAFNLLGEGLRRQWASQTGWRWK